MLSETPATIFHNDDDDSHLSPFGGDMHSLMSVFMHSLVSVGNSSLALAQY